MARLISFLAALMFGGFGLVADARAYTVAGSLEYVTGFTNYFDPANGFVPPGYANEVSPFITFPGTFGFFDGETQVTASFTPYTVTIEEVTSSGSGLLLLDFFETSPQPRFYDYRLVENTFPGLNWGDLDGALGINLPRTMGPGEFTATFVFGAPEPSTWAMLLLGFTSLAWAARGRLARIAIPRLGVDRSA